MQRVPQLLRTVSDPQNTSTADIMRTQNVGFCRLAEKRPFYRRIRKRTNLLAPRKTCFAKSNPIVVTSPMDGSHSLLIRSDSSLALRCRKGAIHPIIRSPHRREQHRFVSLTRSSMLLDWLAIAVPVLLSAGMKCLGNSAGE